VKQLVLMLLAAFLLGGCAQTSGSAAGDNVLPAQTLYVSPQCGSLEQPALLWIASAEGWRFHYGQVMNLRMNPPVPPPVDFPREGVLLLAMGQRPSAGYGLNLIGDTVAIQDGVLTVRVAWREPPPGYRQAQVNSNPCLLLKLPEANFSRFQVLDQDGQSRLEGRR
jgi:hypothetical protein